MCSECQHPPHNASDGAATWPARRLQVASFPRTVFFYQTFDILYMGYFSGDSQAVRTMMKQVRVSCVLALFLLPCFAFSLGGQWLNHGGGIDNWRYARNEQKISTATAPRLTLKWVFAAGGDVAATPAIYKGVLYFPSWDGNVYAIRRDTGALLWSRNLTELTGLAPGEYVSSIGRNLLSRATPTVYRDVLLIGLYGPAVVLALDRHTGRLSWTTAIDSHPWALVTQSGTAYKGFYYIGVSSLEEVAAGSPGYECCSFSGSFQKLDIKTGKVMWRTPLLPDNGGQPGLYSGVAVWGSSPAIDIERKLVFIASGNLYTAPPDVYACEQRQQKNTAPELQDPCLGPEVFTDAVLALELETGKIRWGKAFGSNSAWTYACVVQPTSPNCPPSPGPDFDFGEAPMLLTIPRVEPATSNKSAKRPWLDVAIAAQKSGIVWAFDRDTGDVVWDTVAGPGGISGGAIWGSATDGNVVYTNIANGGAKNFTLLPSKEVTVGGGWVALNATTGKIIWTTASPDLTFATAPVTLANGVLLVSSDSAGGDVFALDGRSGDILWHSAAPNGTVRGGFSVSGGCAFVGAGYYAYPGTSLYAFCVPDGNRKHL